MTTEKNKPFVNWQEREFEDLGNGVRRKILAYVDACRSAF